MIRIGELVKISEDGGNLAFPQSYLHAMELSHIEGNCTEQLFADEECVVIGRSEFYFEPVLAVRRATDGSVFVIREADANIVKTYTLDEVDLHLKRVDAWYEALNTQINLMFYEEVEATGLYQDEDFNLAEWELDAEERAYQMPYLVTLRNMIEGIDE